MATDQANTDALIAAQQTLADSIQNNTNMAEKFYAASRKANGQERQALEGVAALHDSIAKKQQELLEINKEMIDLDTQHFKLMKEQQKIQDLMAKADEKGFVLAKKALADKLEKNKQELALQREISTEKSKILRQVGEDLDATRKQVQEMQKAKGFLGDIFMSARTGAIAAITSTIALKKAFENLIQVGRDTSDIAILSGSYAGMHTEGNLLNPITYAKASTGLLRYAKDMSAVQISLGQFGFTAEEAKTAFKNFSQVSTDTSSMKAMTQAAGGLSKMLGVDLSETTEFMIEQNLKFNRTATQSAETLMHVQMSVETLNRGFDRSIIKGRDITKVLFDISRESKVLAQDQDAISKILTSNIVKLQKGGANYREAFESAKTFTNVLTKDAPEFMKILSGREVYGMLRKNSAEVIAELAKTSPEIAKRVKETYENKNLNAYEKERIINEMTAQTKVGLDASMKVFAQTMGVFQKGAVSRIQSVFGVGFEQARQIVQQAKSELGIKGINDMLKEGLSDEKMTKEIKTKFEMDISESDLKEIKDADAEHREAVIRGIILQKDADTLKAQQLEKEADMVAKISKLKKDKDWAEHQFAVTGREMYKTMAEDAGRSLTAAETEQKEGRKAAEQGTLGGIAGTEAGKYAGGDPFGSLIGKFKGLLSSPLAQLGIGAAGAGIATAQLFLAKQANSYLKEIAENTGGEGPKTSKGMLNSLKDIIKNPRGALKTAAGAIPGIGGALTTGVGELAAGGAAGIGTLAAGVGAAGLAGYGIGKYAVNPALDALTTDQNKYGQDYTAAERAVAKLLPQFLGGMSASEYRDTYTNPAPVDTGQMAPTTAAASGVPGAVSQPGAGQIGFRSEMVPGAQGYDIQLTPFKLGLPGVMAANMSLASQRSTRAPGQ